MARLNNLFLLLAVTGLVSCASAPTEDRPIEPGETDVIICQEPRPQICTREYNPVCANLSGGDTRTYATGCTSCSDSTVVSYMPGACNDG